MFILRKKVQKLKTTFSHFMKTFYHIALKVQTG